MTGLSPTAVIVGVPAGLKSLISVSLRASLAFSRERDQLGGPGRVCEDRPRERHRDDPVAQVVRDCILAHERHGSRFVGITHPQQALVGSRTANTDPPWTWTAFSGSVIAWPSEKDVERTGVTVRPTVSPSVTSPPACPMSKDADLTETVPSSMSAS